VPRAVIIAFCFYLMLGCKNSARHETANENISKHNSNVLTANFFVGTWRYSFPFSTSELVINKNGTFSYRQQGCTNSVYSYGAWTNHGKNLILKSSYRNTDLSIMDFMDTVQVFNYEKFVLLGDVLILIDDSQKPTMTQYQRISPYNYLHHPEAWTNSIQ
jgi:hypothetical protein